MSLSDEILVAFRAEVTELCDALAQGLDGLPRLEAEARADSIACCLRHAHNLKGNASSVGFEEIEKLAHALETALESIRALPAGGETAPLLEAVTLLQRMTDGESLAEESGALIERLLRHGAAPAPAPAPEPDSRPAKDAPPAANRPEAAGRPVVPASAAAGTESIRVETERLDRLMAYAAEMLEAHARLAGRAEALGRTEEGFGEALRGVSPEERARWAPWKRRLEQAVSDDRQEVLRFGRLCTELSEALKRVRMLPLERLAPTWRRLVRETSRELGKEVDFEIEGGAIELDKSVLDQIRDPLIHLLRNALDHGLEAPAERSAKGKPVLGRVRLRADLQGAQVRLEVSDDGRGLDPRRIAEVAVAKGCLTQARARSLSTAETLDLVFASGFSTALEVSRVSGRGVGLDVVRRQVESLGGRVRIADPPALGGATFELFLPVSVLSSKGLLVRAQGIAYALPIAHVERTLRIERTELRQVDGAPAYEAPGVEPLRVRSLAALMGRGGRIEGDRLKAVVVSWAGAKLGVIVDEVLREEEFVARKLPWNLAAVPGVNGAVILADGALALAVDVGWLMTAESAAPTSPGPSPSLGARAGPGGRRVLVVDDSLTSRTLERNTLVAAGFDVLLAVDGEQAWDLLREQSVDLVVADVQMPRLDGLGLTRRIRAHPGLRRLPIILVTSLGSPGDVQAGTAAGADEYLIKGQLEQDTLLEAVTRHL